jgi:NADH dehydrogenase
VRTDCVTGAFGFSGRHIAARLLAGGRRVRTLTDHPDPASPLADRIDARRYAFDDPARLARDLDGVHTLYNTYWVRFERAATTYELAIRNTRRLFAAARAAGVRRIVHVSIANPSLAPDLPYYRGKELLEEELARSGLSFAVVRPTVLFGDGGILIHDIAWLLRNLPVFAVIGSGNYRLQPVHVDDLARLCVERGEVGPDEILDAAGPETFRYRELVAAIRSAVGSRAAVVRVPQAVGLAAARAIGALLRDVLVTREELVGLRRDLLVSRAAPTGIVRFSEWLARHRGTVGAHYLSELALHFAAASDPPPSPSPRTHIARGLR